MRAKRAVRVVHAGTPYGARLIAEAPFDAGEVIAPLPSGKVSAHPTRYSIQVDEHAHWEDIGPLVYLNHSCRPSVIVDTTRLAVVAARNLEPGDELTFFYPSTEWEMANPFTCLCGAPSCIHTVGGAKALPRPVLDQYFLNDHIRHLLDGAPG